MRILDENELVYTRSWEVNHAHEMREVKAFVDSKAHMAELDLNHEYTKSGQCTAMKEALRRTVGHQKSRDYCIFTKKGHVYITWLKWEEQHD